MPAEEIRYLNKACQTWSKAYSVTLKSKKAKEKRLLELQTWDKCNGNELERKAKIIALTNLIES